MAGLFTEDVERNAATSESPLFKPLAYGSIVPVDSSSRHDSLSPGESPRPGYKYPHQHRIIPPVIKGHGRLIVAHRMVPYWVGILFVLGSFTWGVWCALYVYPLLGGRPSRWKAGFWRN